MMKEVKQDHLVFNDLLFRVMMGKAIDATEDNEVVIEEGGKGFKEPIKAIGTFSMTYVFATDILTAGFDYRER